MYVEGITNGINSQRAKILEPLMDSNYALISDQAYWVDDFLQGDVTNFLISYNYCIIVKGNSDLGETKEIIFNDLLNRQSPKEKEKIMKDIQLVWDDENPVKTGK